MDARPSLPTPLESEVDVDMGGFAFSLEDGIFIPIEGEEEYGMRLPEGKPWGRD